MICGLLALYCAKANGQVMHIVLFDTEGVESLDVQTAPMMADFWLVRRKKVDSSRDGACFFTEFDDAGDFDNPAIHRFGLESLDALFGSDSLSTPVSGARLQTDFWLEQLAGMTSRFRDGVESYDVTLVSLNRRGADERSLMKRLAVILGRTTNEGLPFNVDSWTLYDPKTKQVDDVWK